MCGYRKCSKSDIAYICVVGETELVAVHAPLPLARRPTAETDAARPKGWAVFDSEKKVAKETAFQRLRLVLVVSMSTNLPQPSQLLLLFVEVPLRISLSFSVHPVHHKWSKERKRWFPVSSNRSKSSIRRFPVSTKFFQQYSWFFLRNNGLFR